jgi:hypothetical protein
VHAEFTARCNHSQDGLSKWCEVLECVANDNGVFSTDVRGCLHRLNESPHDIEHWDRIRLSCYGQPRTENGEEKTLSYYSFGKRLQDISQEFLDDD